MFKHTPTLRELEWKPESQVYMRASSVQPTPAEQISPYLHFSRAEWASLRASTPLPLNEKDLSTLRGINEDISLDEVAGIYLPFRGS